MRLLFVRHAEPDYVHDSLTEKGRVEAALLAERLCKLDVKAFYVSPMGRAQATAEYTLKKLGREAQTLPWLEEFRGRIINPDTGTLRGPWDLRPLFYAEKKNLHSIDTWLNDPLIQGGNCAEMFEETKRGLDSVLKAHGYEKDGPIYRCEDNKPDTLVFFCHFGISMAMLSYLTDISPLALWQGFCALPSSVTTMITEERTKGEVHFRCMQLGDISHLYAGDEPYSTAGLYQECYTGIDSTYPYDQTTAKK
jgi:Fructose-2,6-bisphosphatase